MYFLLLTGMQESAAQLLLSEDFNYPTAQNGDSIGGGSVAALGYPTWQRHSGASNRAVKYSTTSLSLTGYQGSGVGGSANWQHTDGQADINGDLGTNINSGSVYASFMFRADSVTGATDTCDFGLNFADLAGTSLSNFRHRVFVCKGSSNTKFKIGISKSTGAILTAPQIAAGGKAITFSTTEYNVGQTYIVVMKYTFNPSTTNDSLYLFISPTVFPNTEPTPQISFADSTPDLAQIRSLCIRQGGSFAVVDRFVSCPCKRNLLERRI
jgi:hypothetical protein